MSVCLQYIHVSVGIFWVIIIHDTLYNLQKMSATAHGGTMSVHMFQEPAMFQYPVLVFGHILCVAGPGVL